MMRFKIFGTASSVLLAATILVVGTSPAMAKEKIAVVDIAKVFQTSLIGKSFQVHMKDYLERRKAKAENEKRKFEEESKKLQAEQVQIGQEEGVISKNALREKELAWQKKVEIFRKKQQEFQQKIQTEVNAEAAVGLKKIMRNINDAAQHIGEKYGFSLILSRNPIPYPPLNFPAHSPRIIYLKSDADITQSVINYVNEHASQSGQ